MNKIAESIFLITALVSCGKKDTTQGASEKITTLKLAHNHSNGYPVSNICSRY